jgi:hypothetical protein
MPNTYSMTVSDGDNSSTVARILSTLLLLRTNRLSKLVFLCVLCGWLCGCAGRQNARQLSKAMLRGLELHQTYDQHIYEGYEKALNAQLRSAAAAQRELLESIRHKYLARGCQELSTALENDIVMIDKEIKGGEVEARDAINKAIATYSANPSDQNFKNLQAEIDEFYGADTSLSTVRSKRLTNRFTAMKETMAKWRMDVNASVDAAIQSIDQTEAETAASLQQVSSQLQILQQHYEAVRAGQEQIDQYLNQKTAVQLAFQGVIRGLDIKLPNVNLDSALDGLLVRAQNKMESVADTLTAKLGDTRR